MAPSSKNLGLWFLFFSSSSIFHLSSPVFLCALLPASHKYPFGPVSHSLAMTSFLGSCTWILETALSPTFSTCHRCSSNSAQPPFPMPNGHHQHPVGLILTHQQDICNKSSIRSHEFPLWAAGCFWPGCSRSLLFPNPSSKPAHHCPSRAQYPFQVAEFCSYFHGILFLFHLTVTLLRESLATFCLSAQQVY